MFRFRFLGRDESGKTMTEHALMLALFAVTSSAGIAEMSTSLSYGFYGAGYALERPNIEYAMGGGDGPEGPGVSANQTQPHGDNQTPRYGGGTAEEKPFFLPDEHAAGNHSGHSVVGNDSGEGSNSSSQGGPSNQATYF